ncbi:hypothetical protein [Nonomuraea jabiensis]|uniref:NAD(P)-dependent dehydrogenase (Short-subunit alcohol dehydrogenase family) n=1 Tax=Nonomuraea jabiensis TaxID=882448 RepID=A0A7W9LD70_9ACTN|nr:hypothetical protein [Nonomuraea jabiensis]MBB5779293.1 NAD(P)-dependent dehydrogenase (short-subunit alcohol dehydrogenase family) [Nonomuraea jabiensis]
MSGLFAGKVALVTGAVMGTGSYAARAAEVQPGPVVAVMGNYLHAV